MVVGAYAGDYGFPLPNPVSIHPEYPRLRFRIARHFIQFAFNRWDDERNVNVNRNDNDWNDNWQFAGVRNSLHFFAPL